MGTIVIFLGTLFVTILLGIPIGFGIGITAIIIMYCLGMGNFMMISRRLVSGIDIYTLLAIPFFMLAGEIMNKSGIVKDLCDFSMALVGRFTGGLAHVNVLASMLFAGISGSAVADTSAIGPLLIPMMEKEGYDKDFSVAITVSSSIIGVLIPPSIPMIILGSIAQISIIRLFLGGAIPGVFVGISLMALSYFLAKKRGYPVGKSVSFKMFFQILKKTIWALILPIIILGGILGGIFTATEAGAVAAVYALVIALVIYRMKWTEIPDILTQAAVNTGIVMLVCGAAMALTWYLAVAQVPQSLSSFIMNITENKFVFLFFLNVLLFLMGMVIDLTPNLFLMVPILLPISKYFGIDPVHFGVIMVVNLAIGLITPPVGTVLYVGTAVGNIRLESLIKELVPIYILLFAVVLLITYIAPFVLWLPNLF